MISLGSTHLGVMLMMMLIQIVACLLGHNFLWSEGTVGLVLIHEAGWTLFMAGNELVTTIKEVTYKASRMCIWCAASLTRCCVVTILVLLWIIVSLITPVLKCCVSLLCLRRRCLGIWIKDTGTILIENVFLVWRILFFLNCRFFASGRGIASPMHLIIKSLWKLRSLIIALTTIEKGV